MSKEMGTMFKHFSGGVFRWDRKFPEKTRETPSWGDMGQLLRKMEALLSELKIAEESASRSHDGRDLQQEALAMARSFLEEARKNPFVTMDEDDVSKWFLDAMMHRSPSLRESVEELTQ